MGHVRKHQGPPRRDGSRAEKWRATAIDAGGSRVSKVFDLKGDAKAWVISIEGGKASGSATKSLLDAAEAHYKWFDGLVRKGLREAVTRDDYARFIEHHLKTDKGNKDAERKALPATKLRDLTTVQLQGFLDEMIEGDASADLMKRMRRVLVTWCGYAVRKGWLTTNPARECQIVATERTDASDEDGVYFPTKDELHALIKAAGEGDHPQRDTMAVMVLLFAAPRISEFLGLAEEAVQLGNDGGKVLIRERLDRHYEVLGKVKSKAGRRDIHIGPQAAKAVREWRVKRGPAKAFMHLDAQGDRERKSGRLLPAPDGGPVWGYMAWWRDCWLPMMRRAGLAEMIPDSKGKNRLVQAFGPHALRHAGISLWIEMGMSPKEVQKAAGHAQLKTTMDTYGHLWTNDLADADAARQKEALLLGAKA
jgi:integrase